MLNFTRSAGAHKWALGAFGAVLTLFSVTHATISFFRIERSAFSVPLRFYCERVAFPLLFGLLLLAAIIIPLCHWRKRIAQEQAAAQVEIETGRARLVGNAAALRNEALLEHERLEHLRERPERARKVAARKRGRALFEFDHVAVRRAG